MNTTVPPSSFLFAHPYTPPPTQVRVLAGFWQRVIALFVDGIVTGLPCLVLGLIFQRFFSTSPAWGALIGFVITLCYFSFLASSAVDGQTFGMILTKIEVVNRDGSHISLPRSFIRYFVLLTPFILNANLLLPPRAATAYDFAMPLVGIAIVYLFLFNRRTRQSLHDLAIESFVVDARSTGVIKSENFWRWHWAFIGGIALLGLILTEIVPHFSNSISEVMSIQTALVNTGKVRSPGVERMFRGNHSGIIVETSCEHFSNEREKAASEIASIVINADPAVMDRDYISINCVEGFRVGFASKTSTEQFSHSPEEWKLITGK